MLQHMLIRLKIKGLFCFLMAFVVQAHAGKIEEIKAGVASIDITPEIPSWLSGYASRQTPAIGVLQPIKAKALVIEENTDDRIIFVTVDVLGLSHEIGEDVFTATQAKYGIRRSQLLLNASHTHSGPMIWPCLEAIYDFSEEEQRKVSAYTQQLTQKLIAVIDAAMQRRFPAQLFSGHGMADFAINRRNAIHPDGPVDHNVPVLKVEDMQGNLKAVLFGYACHNTTLVDNNYLVNGDYAGFAQRALEEEYPGMTALFLMGCAGDQNPYPRGTVELAQQHGTALATSVEKTLNGAMRPVHPPIHTNYNRVYLAYQPVQPSEYQKDIIGTDKFLQRRAKLMLEAYNKGWIADKLSYPVQVVQFNNDLTILGMGNEVVVDYSLLFKKMFPSENLYVAGYCNEVQCYIPSKRVLKEGGYEANENMIYYGMPGPFAGDVEERIIKAVSQLMKELGIKSTVNQVTKKEQWEKKDELKGTLGTYAFPPTFANGDIDAGKLIAQLKDIHANTYHWLAWGKHADFAAFKKFLPMAAQANIRVWITLVPPSESPPFARDYSEPYRLDYEKWAIEIARLSVQEPALMAWSIDDFVHNLHFFTKEYMHKIVTQVKAINPGLAFIPCAYYEQVTPRFVTDYGAFMDGILFPYRNESVFINLDDPGYVKSEIEDLRALFAPGFRIFLDIYATGHSIYGNSTPAYVRDVLRAGKKYADGVLIYCHQDPDKYPEKYQVVKQEFATP
jgi:hypothetical protein